MLAEILLELILSRKGSIVRSLNSKNVAGMRVLSALGHTLPQMFAETQNIIGEVHSVSAECLTSLIAKGVAESVILCGVSSLS